MEKTTNLIIKEAEIVRNPSGQDLTKVRRNVKQDIIPHFTKDEMIELLKGVPPDRTGVLFQFAWRTGMRVTEIVSIKKGDIDFENEELTIRWLKSRKAHHRVLCMHQSLKNPLYMYSAQMKYDDRLFAITRQRADQLAKKYGFDHMHKIRHSFAVNFLRQSRSPYALVELKEMLGHSKIETTMQYLKVVPMAQKESMRRIQFD
jgi:integrase/recombinase XerD